MTHPARVLACGWFGEGNLGDEAMLEGLIRLLRRTFDKPAITVMTADLEDARRRFGVSAITRATPERSGFRNLPLVRASARADLVTLGGGDLIREQADGTVPARNWLARVRVPLALGRPVAVIGVSVGELRTPAVIEEVRHELLRCTVIAARDAESSARLRDLTGREALVMGDLALEALDDPDTAAVVGGRAREAASGEDPGRRPRIGVAIRNIQGRGASVQADAGDRLTAALAAALDQVVNATGATVELVPFRTGRAKRDDDALAGAALAAQATTGNAWVHHAAPGDARAFAAIARELDIVVGVRLHATILAAASGVPMLGIAYDPKVSGFLDDLGLPGQCLPLDADADTIAATITRTLADMTIRPAALAGVERMRARTVALEPLLRQAARR